MWSSTSPPPEDPAAAQNLGEAVSRWNAEGDNPAEALGPPLLGAARDLSRGLGSGDDTITAFPTGNGAVCYEIRAAGSCSRLDNDLGFTFSILYTRDGGTRVFGIVSDDVRQIDVVIDGATHRAVIDNSAFYYQLSGGHASGDVDRVIATWHDGSTHALDGPG